MRKKHIIAIAAAMLLLAGPIFAVFKEKNIGQTLNVLRCELQEQNEKLEEFQDNFRKENEVQRTKMRKSMIESNELALILYSQDQDYTFDMTYALKLVMQRNESFDKNRLPYDELVSWFDIEIDRYERLAEALRRLPPAAEIVDDIPDSLYTSSSGMIYGLRRRPGDRPKATSAPNPAVQMPAKEELHEEESHDEEAPHATNILVSILTGNGLEGAQSGVSDGLLSEVASATDEDTHMVYRLDEEQQEDRDTCMAYALNMLRLYKSLREDFTKDSEHYADMRERLEGNYDYALKRYRQIQRHIFIDGQDNYFSVLKTLPAYTRKAFKEAKTKYSAVELHHEEGHEHHHADSEWRGPVIRNLLWFVLGFMVIATVLSTLIMSLIGRLKRKSSSENYRLRKTCTSMLCGVIVFAVSLMIAGKFVNHNFIQFASRLLLNFCWLMIAILVSLLIRTEPRQVKTTMKSYIPVVLMGFFVIFIRIIFIPNNLVNLIFPPLLLIFAVWQWAVFRRSRKELQRGDRIYALLTFIVLAACTVMSWAGYVLLSVQVLMWWLFQIAALSTVTAVQVLLDRYESSVLKKSFVRYKAENKGISDKGEGAFIEVSWFYDLIRMAMMPVMAVLTVPVSIWLASGVFDLTAVCMELFFRPFFDLADADGNAILHLSVFRLVLVICLYYVFKYLAYAIRSFYRHIKLQKLMRDTGKDYVRANEVNLTLANNIIAILVWGGYAFMVIKVLKIPMKSVTMVLTGLSAGIGLALKDVLNNFIYGIQLMSGRLRVGDYIECDGIRGKVESITYQSTQIETLDGAIMAITNTTLFNKNFQNLTRNNSYECVKIPVGVAYGSDVEKVRSLLTDAMKSLDTKDKYGRHIIDQKRGITVAFSGFGDSSVDLIVKQFVLVEEEIAYVARAKEIIYNTLNENGIEIPFPQRDVYIRKFDKGDES